MLVTVSQFIVLALGLFVCMFAVAGITVPLEVTQRARKLMSANWLIHVAVVARLILGCALIVVAPVARFPLIFQVLGLLSIVSALTIAVMGRERLRRFIDWFFERSSVTAVRVWMLFALAFGGFLIYGVL